jgi:predicted HTH transcriptional regulator
MYLTRCREAGLPEPSFEQRGGQFVATLWRDWLTDAVMEQPVLNDRQRKGLVHMKTHGTMTNAETSVSQLPKEK